jgi:hypothetical protein
MLKNMAGGLKSVAPTHGAGFIVPITTKIADVASSA